MPRKKADETAAGLLGKWTDSDTSMQIVGTSLGVFGVGRLDPEVVLAKETPLRNALFDVLLNLVEGGALDVRPTGDGYYAFRWRADYAVGAIKSDMVGAVDIDAPSPYLAELTEARRQRDAAVKRAEEAEALAVELEAELDELDPIDDAELGPVAAAEPVSEPERQSEPVAAAEAIDLVALEDDAKAADVVYLTPAATEGRDRAPSKWSPYTLEKPRSQMSGVERLANQG
jgi:hypothetical protein